MINGLIKLQKHLHKLNKLDFLAPLAIRLYLVPIFWMAGSQKFVNFSSTVEWFGNSDWGLGLPMPAVMVALVTGAELLGAIFLLIGFATRWISIPLMITMVVAALTVHLENGWLAIANASHESAQRLSGFMGWLQDNFSGRHEFITELGQPIILNNGIEFAVTYFVMLLALFFMGGGKYVSVDYWLGRKWLLRL